MTSRNQQLYYREEDKRMDWSREDASRINWSRTNANAKSVNRPSVNGRRSCNRMATSASEVGNWTPRPRNVSNSILPAM